jgi:putative ABC transport system permease protein
MIDWPRTLWSRIRALGNRGRLEDDLRNELDFHLAMREQQMRDAGAPDASTAARRRFGNVASIRAAMRDARVTPWWQEAVVDARIGARMLLRDRGFLIAAILTLGLGIGLNTAMYAIVGSLLVREPPFAEAERLVVVRTQNDRGRRLQTSGPDFDDWRAATGSFSALGAVYAGQSVNVGGDGGVTQRLRSGFVTANLFGALGLVPALGRDFTPADDQVGSAPVALIAHQVWRDRYASDPTVLGATIRVNGALATIVGVMPEGVQFPDNVAIWLPRTHVPADVRDDARDARLFEVFGRLAAGVSIEQARAELDGIGRRLAEQYPATNARFTPAVTPLGEQGTAATFEVLLLQALVASVLLVACANVGGLLLVRTARRMTEMSVRASLGASRWRMARQLIAESAVLAALAGVAGLVVSLAGTRWLTATIGNVTEYGVAYDLSTDWTVFAFLAGCALVTVGVGLAPALLVSKTDVNATLKDGSGGTGTGLRVRRWTGTLVVAELVVTVALLTVAGLITRSLLARQTIDIGIDTSQLLTMRISMVSPEYADVGRRADAFRRLEERLALLPEVDAGTMTTAVPFTFGERRALSIEGRVADGPAVTTLLVGDRYFDTLGVSLLRGRAFTPADGQPGQESAIINRRFVEIHFAGEDPLGRRIRLAPPNAGADAAWLTIVGVAPDVRQLESERAHVPVAYLPHRSEVPRTGDLLLRARSGIDPLTLVLPVRRALQEIDANLAFFNVWTLDQYLAERRAEPRLFASIIGTFALFSLLLSALGLYGVAAYAVAQRTREFGLRVALGARPRALRGLVMRVTLQQLAFGLPLGLVAGVSIGEALRSELYGIEPADPLTLLVIVSAVLGVTVVASLVPAQRAARLDPMVVLRRE